MATPTFELATTYIPRDHDCLLLPYLNEKKAAFPARLLPREVVAAARPAKERGASRTAFRGSVDKAGLLVCTARLDAEHSSPRLELKKAVAAALAIAQKEECKRLVVPVESRRAELIPAAQEGTLLGGYVFDTYMSKKTPPLPVLLVSDVRNAAAVRKQLGRRAVVHECVNFARDVLNEPPNVMQPPSLAQAFATLGRRCGLKVAVWDEKHLAREKCGGVLGVGQGAKAKPRMVIGEYAPRGARRHLCLVGKGITFDTGGYCLKPADAQVGMKYDMGGAAMVFPAACAIARLKLPIRLTVITPLAENAISGEAFHTTSILTTRSGRTVEVHNTDAEGRLILADALTLAAERKPDWIIDAATLTGACVIALGNDIAGAFGTDAAFTKSLIRAGSDEDELYWELPLHMPYAEQLKTTIADCKNVTARWGGSITAALFLKQWVPNGTKWIHCDIAGPGIKEEPLAHLGKGANGFGVKTLVTLAERLGKK